MNAGRFVAANIAGPKVNSRHWNSPGLLSCYTSCMTTTIQLEEKLFEEAQAYAAETGRSLTAVIEDALRETLSKHRPPIAKQHVKLKTHGQGGLQPGIDLDNTAALLDLMDSPNAAS
jgi:hypothetical protein